MRLRRREPEAAGLLYDRYGKAAYGLALRIVGNRAAAEDVVAEAVLKLWNRVSFFRETRSSALGVWFLVITGLQAREFLAQHDRKLSGDPAKEVGIERPVLFENWQQAIDPELAEELYVGLSLLTEDERKVLDAGFFEAISPSRLAERMGSTTGEIERLIVGALKKVSPSSGE